MLQIYTDKSATALKSKSWVDFRIDVPSLNMPAQFRRFMIEHGYILDGFLPIVLQGSQSEKYIEVFCDNSDTGSDEITPMEDEHPLVYSVRG